MPNPQIVDRSKLKTQSGLLTKGVIPDGIYHRFYTVKEETKYASVRLRLINTSSEAAVVTVYLTGKRLHANPTEMDLVDTIEPGIKLGPKSVFRSDEIVISASEAMVIHSDKPLVVARLEGFENRPLGG